MCQPMCTGHCTVLCTALFSALSNVLCSAQSSVMYSALLYSALLYSALLYRALHNGGGEARKLILFPGCVADSHLLGAQDVLCFPSICILRAVLRLWCFYTKNSYNCLADVYRWKQISPSLRLTPPGTIFGVDVSISFYFREFLYYLIFIVLTYNTWCKKTIHVFTALYPVFLFFHHIWKQAIETPFPLRLYIQPFLPSTVVNWTIGLDHWVWEALGHCRLL